MVSSLLYHAHRPDIVVCYLTTQVVGANAPTDCPVIDWREAGLRQPSAFRAFFSTVSPAQVTKIGRLSEADWEQVQEKLRLALEI